MAFFRGEEGSVKFDDAGSSASAITSTRSWSLTLDKEVLETTVMGDTYAGNVGGIISGNGSVEVIYTASSSATVGEIEIITVNFVTNGSITTAI